MDKKYYWTAQSNDGAFDIESGKCFATKEECYNDMRNSALEKMKWNTEYYCDFADVKDGDYIGYEVKFYPNKIIHLSYSGTYTYEMKEKNTLPTIPYVAHIYTDKYDEKKCCYYVDVYKPLRERCKTDEYEIVAEIYLNGYVKYLNTKYCGVPQVIEEISKKVKTLANKRN